MANITILRPKDPTAALRMKRYRQRQKAKDSVTSSVTPTVTIDTPAMCALASRLTDGRATPDDLALAEQLILAFVLRLPRDSSIKVPKPAPTSAA